MKAYILKYTFGEGKGKVPLEEVRDYGDGTFKRVGGFNLLRWPDIAFSKEEAIKKAEILRKNKIDALKRQIQRLEKLELKFEE